LTQLSKTLVDAADSDFDNAEEGEQRPLLPKLNPNSALIYHPIKLPKSSSTKKYGEWSKKMKKGRKVLHDVDDLVSDLYSEHSHSRGPSSAFQSPGFERKNGEAEEIPEIRLSIDNDEEISH
jgi:hypothetical protein